MADKQIGSLPAATTVDDDSLFVCEQQGTAMKTTGAQWKGYAQNAVSQYVNEAREIAEGISDSVDAAVQSAADAAQSATDAAQSATEAADSAETAKEYSGKPPIIQNDTWWTWDAELDAYVDTGEAARGGIMYATFEIDVDTGELIMYTPDAYNGPTFALVNGYLEVNVNG